MTYSFKVPLSQCSGGADIDPSSNSVYFIIPGSPNDAVGTINAWSAQEYRVACKGTAELTDQGLDLDELAGPAPDLILSNGMLEPSFGAQVAEEESNSDPASLPSLLYSDVPLDVQDLSTDKRFRVATNSNQFAKVRIFRDATDGNKVKAEWVTYRFVYSPEAVGFGYQDPRDLVLSLENGVLVAYVSALFRPSFSRPTDPPQGILYRVPSNTRFGKTGFALPSESSLYTLAQWNAATGLSNPQQIALHGRFTYVVNNTSLLRVDPTKVSPPFTVFSGLTGAKGLLISEDGTRAYVTDSANGGRLVRLRMDPAANGTATLERVLRTDLGPTGFMSWANEERTELFLPRPGANEVLRVSALDTENLVSHTLLSGTPLAPLNVLPLSERQLVVVSRAELGMMDLDVLKVPGNLLLGIGLVPFQFINQDPASPNRGRADTSVVNYFFRVQNVPFGGSLNLMLNHEEAYELGARFYRVRMGGLTITDSFPDFRWDTEDARFNSESTRTLTVGGTTDLFPVRNPDDLWYNPYLSAIINSRRLPNELNTLEVSFFNAAGRIIDGMTVTRVVLIDNHGSSATLDLPFIGGRVPNLQCGALKYATKADEFRLPFRVHHPTDNAEYQLTFQRGNDYLPALTEAGPVRTANPPKITTVGAVLGQCNIGNVYIHLGVYTRVTDGYRWINSTGVARSFTLVPDSVVLD